MTRPWSTEHRAEQAKWMPLEVVHSPLRSTGNSQIHLYIVYTYICEISLYISLCFFFGSVWLSSCFRFYFYIFFWKVCDFYFWHGIGVSLIMFLGGNSYTLFFKKRLTNNIKGLITQTWRLKTSVSIALFWRLSLEKFFSLFPFKRVSLIRSPHFRSKTYILRLLHCDSACIFAHLSKIFALAQQPQPPHIGFSFWPSMSETYSFYFLFFFL